MNELTHMSLMGFILSLIWGLLLGGIFFGGLWLTVQKTLDSSNRILLFILSFIGRFAVIALGMYLTLLFHWSYLITCFIGLLVTRRLFIKPGMAMLNPGQKVINSEAT
jgi:F1F0 ATPase subunit 2